MSLRVGSYQAPARGILGSSVTSCGDVGRVPERLERVAARDHGFCEMAVSPFDVVLALRTTNSIIRLARILPACCYRSGGRSRDVHTASAIAYPFAHTVYAVSATWAFEALDSPPLLCALTAMKKAPVYSLPLGGERRGKTSWWCGHCEMRCGSLTCSGSLSATRQGSRASSPTVRSRAPSPPGSRSSSKIRSYTSAFLPTSTAEAAAVG